VEVCFGTHPDNEPTQLESPDMKESFAAGLQSQSCLEEEEEDYKLWPANMCAGKVFILHDKRW